MPIFLLQTHEKAEYTESEFVTGYNTSLIFCTSLSNTGSLFNASLALFTSVIPFEVAVVSYSNASQAH